MPRIIWICALASLLAIAAGNNALAGSTMVGTANDGNCYPFMCNDSGTGAGPSIQYQQVFSSNSFGSNAVNITSETFYWNFAQQYGGNDTLLGGTYIGYLSTTSAQVNNLNGGCLSCNVGANDTQVFDFTVPSGGVSFGQSYTINNSTGFMFDPSQGNLLLDIFASNQDNVPNGSGNSYSNADHSGDYTSRAYAFNGSNSGTPDSIGLVTTFGSGQTTSTHEPASLMLLGSGLIGVAGAARRKLFSR